MRDQAQSMRVAFRTDASLEIGTGHVMRCLTLADALMAQGSTPSLFICRAHEGHLADLVRVRGHRVAVLPAAAQSGPNYLQAGLTDQPQHSAWLGLDWSTDAKQTQECLASELAVDWLVVDHYALGARWEQALRPHSRHLMAIDDLADRMHDCDLLLDQNLGRAPQDYLPRVPGDCQILAGSRYALLRPAFAQLRPDSLSHRRAARLGHLLISMGGVDKDNATGACLAALAAEDLPPDCVMTVVMGPHAPWLEAVSEQAKHLPWQVQVLIGVQDMASLMAKSDLAIGAAGTTSWERCCLGVPALTVVLAENQWPSARALQEAKAAILVGTPADIAMRLGPCLRQARSELASLSARASEVCAGDGARLVVEAMWGRHACIS